MNSTLKQWMILSAALLLLVHLKAFGDTAWTNGTGGFWHEAGNWSFGVPHAGQAQTYIVFGGESKTVIVDTATPATNLVIQRLNLGGQGITNTLLLTGVVLEVRSTLEMRPGSALQISDSMLRLPSAGSSLDLNAGELWLQNGALLAGNVSTRIGRDDGRAVMRIDSGSAELGEVLLGRRVSRSGAEGLMLLSGGVLVISGKMDVGADTNCTGEVVMTGGELIATNSSFGTAIGEQGDGVLVNSNGLALFGNLDVGRHTNVIGMFHAAGGTNSIENLAIGRFPQSTGMVFQTAGELGVEDMMYIGQEGRGEMTISGGLFIAENILVPGNTNTASGLLTLLGGTALIESNLFIGTTVSTGLTVLAGGVLAVTNAENSGLLEVVQGYTVLEGAAATVDRLRLTSSLGMMSFNSGLLSSADTVISNGVAFVVGDGTNAATFHLRGGTHYFADGLVISSNAILTGCGTIIGSVINQGTMATNCGPAAPVLLSPAHTNGQFSFHFESQSNARYTVEFAPAVNAAIWDVLTVTNGNGGLILIQDTSAIPSNRFYRVKAE